MDIYHLDQQTPQQKRDFLFQKAETYIRTYGADRILVHLFNDALLPVLYEHGTDRATYEERNHIHYRPQDNEYSPLLKRFGLTSADGTYAKPYSAFQADEAGDLFEDMLYTVPKEHIAVVFFDQRQLTGIYNREYNDFYIIENPKQAAVLAVFAQQRNDEELFLELLSFEDKMAYCRLALRDLGSDEQAQTLQQRFFELQQQYQTKKERNRFKLLWKRFSKRWSEILFMESWCGELETLREYKTTNRPGMSTTFMLQHIDRELENKHTKVHIQELLALKEGVERFEEEFQ